ncbi:MAG: hypothetical protein M1828_005306 [Chrysothrix sp. TS-e1954]|nr:MAG: hypothetical protein M1828_005306 [Chrysothrix sp. TS-e1954]
MDQTVKSEDFSHPVEEGSTSPTPTKSDSAKAKARSRQNGLDEASKRRCCDGNLPACAACSSVYGTDCVYDPNSDHRRKGVYKKDLDNLKTRNSTLQTLIQGILNYPEDDVPDLVRQIRTCESLDKVAESIIARENGSEEPYDLQSVTPTREGSNEGHPSFEKQLSSKLGQLRLDDGSLRYIGGTSNLLYLTDYNHNGNTADTNSSTLMSFHGHEDAITSWTRVTSDRDLIVHLLNMYFTWHYTFFTTLSKSLFYRDFNLGKTAAEKHRGNIYCTPLLVNVMLALGCHFTSHRSAREDSEDSATAGDHFFREAKRLLMDDDEYERPRLATVQALALMSVREAGCGREGKGWAYSGISFRMACDLGLNFHSGGLPTSDRNSDEAEEDERRITFWGCFLFDKCWSNYLGRLPLFQTSVNITVPKFEVLPTEEADIWSPYSDSGFSQAHAQPSRVRAVALQISALCDINCDLMRYFYHPQQLEKPASKQLELKRSSEIHTRLEAWKRELPKELEPREGGLSSVLVMHMMFQLLYIHLFRAFLKYDPKSSPLPANVSPRKLCTQAAGTISKLLRLYKRSYGLRQICNIVVYIAHSASTIHLLNLPDKNAKRDIVHGVKHLEEIAEGWLCARRTLCVLSDQSHKWNIELPEEAASVLARTDAKYGPVSPPKPSNGPSPSDQIMSTAADESETQQTPWAGGYGSYGMQKPDLDMFGFSTDAISSQPIHDAGYHGYEGYDASHHYTLPASTSQLQPGLTAYHPQPSQPLDHIPSFADPPPPNQFNTYPHPQNLNTAQIDRFENGTQRPIERSLSKKLPQPVANKHQQSIQTTQQTQRPSASEQFEPQRPPQPQPRETSKHRRKVSFIPTSNDSMFGGVEALLREGEEWWVKDGGQVASGFPNWGFDVNSMGRARPTPVPASADAAQQRRKRSIVADSVQPITTTAPSNNGNGTSRKDAPSTENFGGIINEYNENDWYQ